MLSLRNSKRTYYLLTFIVVVGLSTVFFNRITHSGESVAERKKESPDHESDKSSPPQTDAKFDPLKYLPAGANISNPKKHVVLADLDSDGKQEMIIFYSLINADKPQADIMVLKASATGFERLWDDVYEGGSGFADPTGVYDLNRSGRLQIVAYRVVGASCPGVLQIFQWANGTVERIAVDWAEGCQADLEIKDLDNDGVSEIIFRPLKYGVNRRIYSWTGKEYARTDKQHANYFTDELQQIVGWIFERRPLPTPSRSRLCEQAVQIYLLQRRYPEAVKLCKAVLSMIDDPELTQPNSGAMTAEQNSRVLAFFEVDKIKDKARVYRLLADASKAAGDLESAKRYYTETRKLESEAKERGSRLPF
jgi:hypothetical protein